MNKLDFVDTHFHLWDLDDPNLYYEIFEEDYEEAAELIITKVRCLYCNFHRTYLQYIPT